MAHRKCPCRTPEALTKRRVAEQRDEFGGECFRVCGDPEKRGLVLRGRALRTDRRSYNRQAICQRLWNLYLQTRAGQKWSNRDSGLLILGVQIPDIANHLNG